MTGTPSSSGRHYDDCDHDHDDHDDYDYKNHLTLNSCNARPDHQQDNKAGGEIVKTLILISL